MKLIVSVVLMSCLVSGLCAQKKIVKSTPDFELRGQVAGLKSSKMILASRIGDSTRYDTTNIINGAFVFKGKLAGPTLSALWTIEPEFMHEQFIENHRMTIVRKDTAGDVVFSGSLSEKENKITKQYWSDFYAQGPVIKKQFDEKCKTDSVAAENYFKAASKELVANYHYRLDTFIRSHPASIVSAYQLSNMSRTVDVSKVQALYQVLTTQMKQSAFGKETVRQLKARSETAIGVRAIEFTQRSDKGEEVSLQSFRGKYVLIDFWASWCGPCRAENPNVVRSYLKYKNKGFEILGVSLDDQDGKWKEAILKDQLAWTQVSDLKGWKNEVAAQYSVAGIPANFLIDPQGIIIAKNLRGADLESKLASIFEK